MPINLTILHLIWKFADFYYEADLDLNIAVKLKIKMTRNQTKDQPAILKPKNCQGISAQLPSPINSALITSAKGNTSIIYSRGGRIKEPHLQGALEAISDDQKSTSQLMQKVIKRLNIIY